MQTLYALALDPASEVTADTKSFGFRKGRSCQDLVNIFLQHFITDEKNLRTSVAMTIPKTAEIEENEEVSTMFLNGKYGVGHFEISAGEYGGAWNYMYNNWLFKEK